MSLRNECEQTQATKHSTARIHVCVALPSLSLHRASPTRTAWSTRVTSERRHEAARPQDWVGGSHTSSIRAPEGRAPPCAHSGVRLSSSLRRRAISMSWWSGKAKESLLSDVLLRGRSATEEASSPAASRPAGAMTTVNIAAPAPVYVRVCVCACVWNACV